MIRRRLLVASLAATLVAGLLAMIPGTPAVSAAPNDKSPRLVEQTEASDVYANGDGTYKAVFYAGPVNFFDKATNQWRKLDKQFRQVGDRIENGAGPARVQLPTQMSAAAEVSVAKDDWSVSFAFTDATSTRPAKIVKGHVRYDDVAPGVSLDYRMLSNGLKEDIVLDQPRPAGSAATFRFRLSAQGATPVAVDGGTAVALQDAKGQEVARIPRGTMVDARGLKGVVDMRLTNQNGAWSVDVAPDAAFLQGAAYPVRIDPAVIYTPLSPTDAFVDSICTTCNYGGLDFLKAGWVGNAQYFAYVRFPDLTRILGKGVTNAELRLQSSYEDDPSRFGLTALRTHGSWNASSITWANMANHGPERYDVDRNQQLGPAYYFPITSWAQGWAAGQDGDWINGKWSPRGATINTAGDNAFYQLGAAESTFTPEIPQMSVTYTNQTPNVITTLSPAPGWSGIASPPLSAVFSDPDDTNGWIEYSVDGVLRGQFTTINGSTAPNFGLGAGTHTWQVRGVDADSYGPWSAVRYLTINPTSLIVQSTSHRLGLATANRNLSASWSGASGTAGVTGYSWTLNTSQTTPADAVADTSAQSLTTTIPGNGTWWLHVRPVDSLGNAGPDMAFGRIMVDSTAVSASVSTTGFFAQGVNDDDSYCGSGPNYYDPQECSAPPDPTLPLERQIGAPYQAHPGYVGPYYDPVVAGNSVVLMNQTITTTTQGKWQTWGLVRNETATTVGTVTVKAKLYDSVNALLGQVSTTVPLASLRPHEPGPFNLPSQVSAYKVARVEWTVTSAPPTTTEPRQLLLGEHWQAAYGTRARIEGTFYTDPATTPYPYVAAGTIMNDSTAALTNPGIVVAGMDLQGRVVALMNGPLQNEDGSTMTSLPSGGTGQYIVSVSDPVVAKRFDSADYLIYWGTQR